MRPWLWPEALMMKEFYRIIGATGVPMEIPEVYAGLQTGMIDTVLASAITSLATLWFTKTPYVSQQGGGYITGAFVIARKKYEAMPKDISGALAELAEKYQHQVVYNLRKADLDAFKRLLKRGIKSVKEDDFSEWQKVMDKITQSFVGRLYTRQMLNRVKAICKKYAKKG
jgi:TRAP-type C4-dicarboxylate transport system substrate-binding protein